MIVLKRKDGDYVLQNNNKLNDSRFDNIRNRETNYNKEGHDNDKIVRKLLLTELSNMGYTFNVDLDKYDWARELDIDLICTGQNKQTIFVEVKVDSYKVLNDGKKYCFIETISNTVKNVQGWLYTSRANFFIFYFTLFDDYVVINRLKLIKYINENINKLEHKRARTFSPDGEKIWYETEGVMLSVYDILQNGLGNIYHSSTSFENVKKSLGL